MASPKEIPANTRRTALWLGAAGAIPFVLAAAVAWVLTDSIVSDWMMHAAFLYGAVILSFLGGIHWGLALRDGHSRGQHFIIGVVPSLVGWAAVLMPMRIGLTVLALAFVGQFLLDLRLSLPAWFKGLRAALTAVVAASLFLIALVD